MDRLQILIFSFYRENLDILENLAPLRLAHMSRSWGAIRIECVDSRHMREVINLMPYLKLPFSLLRLGRKIFLLAPDCFGRSYSVDLPYMSDLLTEF